MALGKTIREFGVKIALAFDKGSFSKVDAAVSGVADTLKTMGIEAAAAAGTIFGLAEATASNAFDLEQQSKALGINAERLQELAYGAKVAGGASREDLAGGLEAINTTLDDFRSGNPEVTKAFNDLNISQGELADRSKTADQWMAKVADRLNTINDPQRKAALGVKIFGSAYKKLAPYLDKGSAGMVKYGKEARNLGIVMSDKTLKSQAKFQEQMLRLMEVLKSVSYVIGGVLIKTLSPLVAQFQKWVLHNKAFITSGIVAFLQGLGKALAWAFTHAVKIAEVFKKIIVAFGGAAKFGAVLFKALMMIGAARLLWAVGALGVAMISLGLAMAPFAVIGAALIAFFGGLYLAYKRVVEIISDPSPFKKLGAILSEAFSGGFMDTIHAFADVLNGIVKTIEYVVTLGGKLGSFASWGSSIKEGAKSLLGFGSAAPAGASAGGGVNNQFQTQVTVAIPPGTSATQAQSIVAGGVNDGLHGMLRQTASQSTGGVAY